MTESHWSDMLADNPPDLPAPADDGASSDDLAGELEVIEAEAVTVYLVGGQSADPKSIRPAGEGAADTPPATFRG